MGPHITTSLVEHGYRHKRTLIVAMSGILTADCRRFFSPMERELFAQGDVLYVSYTANGFDADATAHDIADAVITTVRDVKHTEYEHIVLLGASLGASLVGQIVEVLDGRHLGNQRVITKDMLEAWIFEGTSGVTSIFGWVNRAFARITPYIPQWRWLEWCFGAVLSLMLEGPKTKNLEEWSPTTGYTFLDTVPWDKKERDKAVKQFRLKAMREALRSSPRRYIQQIAWLTWPSSVSTLKGVNTTYIACVSPANTTVIQPLAAEDWKRWTDCKVIEVPGAHIAFAERPTTYRQLIEQLAKLSVLCKVRAAPTWSRPFKLAMKSSFPPLRPPPPGQYYLPAIILIRQSLAHGRPPRQSPLCPSL